MARTHITNAHSSYVHRQSLSLESFIYVKKWQMCWDVKNKTKNPNFNID